MIARPDPSHFVTPAILQATKEGIEHDLLRCPPHGEQRANETRQGELARAREGVGELNVPRIGSKLSRMDSLSELGEKTA